MPPDTFLHERSDFKALVETAADSEKINDPALVEAERRRVVEKTLAPGTSVPGGGANAWHQREPDFH